ncbi:hypothetical protein LTS18_013453, partial [Coniosporium uncinatum]
MGLFGFATKRREEYYLLKLLARSIKEEMDASDSLQDYLRGNYFWTKVLTRHSRSPKDRKYLKEVFGPVIKGELLNNEELDLESDPMQIYRSAINNEELRTGRQSRRNPNISREEAIRDPETRETFIEHLKDLRDITDSFLQSLEDTMHKMPFGVRYLAQELYESLRARFPHENGHHLMRVVGHWVWKTYLAPSLTQPEQWGVIDRGLSPLQKKNLGEVSKVISQIAAGRPFGGENVLLKPLDNYISEALGKIDEIWANMIEVPAAEEYFDTDEFNDLYARTKPTLYIKLTDIFAIHQLVTADLPTLCPDQNDVLREVIRELGSAQTNENEMRGVSSTEISLTLNPKFHAVEDPDAPVKQLFMETKRCVLYIIRVQTGSNLLEILVRPVTASDEQRWAQLIHDEQRELRASPRKHRAYTDTDNESLISHTTHATTSPNANPLQDLTALSYTDLKRTCLENVLT